MTSTLKGSPPISPKHESDSETVVPVQRRTEYTGFTMALLKCIHQQVEEITGITAYINFLMRIREK
jgi:hypothetical protein